MDDPSTYYAILGIPDDSSRDVIQNAYLHLINNRGNQSTNSRKRYELLTQVRDHLIKQKEKDNQHNAANDHLMSNDEDYSYSDPSECFKELKIPEESSIEFMDKLRKNSIIKAQEYLQKNFEIPSKHFQRQAKLCDFLIQFKIKQMEFQCKSDAQNLSRTEEIYDELMSEVEDDETNKNIENETNPKTYQSIYPKLPLDGFSSPEIPLDTDSLDCDNSNKQNKDEEFSNSLEQVHLNDIFQNTENASNSYLDAKVPIFGNSTYKKPDFKNFNERSSDNVDYHTNKKDSTSNSAIENTNQDEQNNEKDSNNKNSFKVDLFLTFEEIFRGETKRITLRVMDGSIKIKDEYIKIKIKHGITPGTEITYSNQNSIIIPPEIIFVVRDEPNQIFKRLNSVDIEYTAHITTKQSNEGCELSIPTLENDPIMITFEDEITDDNVEEFSDRGLPFLDIKKKRGKLFVKFEISDNKSNFQYPKGNRNIIVIEKQSFKLPKEPQKGIYRDDKINNLNHENQDDSEIKPTLNSIIPELNKNYQQFILDDTNKSKDNKKQTNQFDHDFKDSKYINENEINHSNIIESYALGKEPQEQLPPNEFDLNLTLEEIYRGCTKHKQIVTKIISKDRICKEENKIVKVVVEAGSINGRKIVCQFEGDQEFRKIPADVIFTVCEEKHSIFKRREYDIEYVAKITAKEAIMGGEIKIPTLENKPYLLSIKGGIAQNSEEKIPNYGLPNPLNGNKRGNLVVTFKIMFDKEMAQDEPIEHNISVTLEQIMNGCYKKVRIKKIVLDRNGTEVEEEKILTMDIKPGTAAGTRFAFPREGDQNPGKIPADIVFIVCDKAHDLFKRIGSDIEYTKILTKSQFGNGGNVEIPTLVDGTKQISLDGMTNEKIIRKLNNCGLPIPNKLGKRGNQIVKFKIIDDPQDEPIINDLELSLEQILIGCKKKMKINRNIFDYFGNLIATKIEEITIDIEKGTHENKAFKFDKLGDKNPGAMPADIIFVTKYKKHPIFELDGFDLNYTVPITKNEAKNGVKLEIPSLEGEMLSFSKKDIKFNGVHKFNDRGLPFPGDQHKRGDLIVRFHTVENNLKDEEIVRDILLTLEELDQGAAKRLKIQRKIIDQDTKDGKNEENVEKIITVNVQPGTKAGRRLRHFRLGDQYPGRIPADIVFIVSEADHKLFKRNGDDLEYTVEINEEDAKRGCDLQIPTLNNGSKRLNIERPITEKVTHPFKDAGLPNVDNPKKRGKLLVKFKIIKSQKTATSSQSNTGSNNKQQNKNKNPTTSLPVEKTRQSKRKNSTNSTENYSELPPPQKYELPLTLEDISRGLKKEISIFRKSFDQDKQEYSEEIKLQIEVKPGTVADTEIVHTKTGDQNEEMIRADIIYTVIEKPHELFTRKGNNLLYVAKISQIQASGNCKVNIPTLDGDPIEYPIEEAIESFSVRKIDGHGFPLLDDNEKRGDMLVTFEIVPANEDSLDNFALQEPPIEHDLPLTLKDVLTGRTFKKSITRKVYDLKTQNYIDEKKQITINVKPGTEEGTRFKFPQEGDKIHGRIPSDIIFITKDEPHAIFTRMGSDLELLAPIRAEFAKKTFKMMIPTLTGEIEIEVKKPLKNPIKVIDGYGLPYQLNPKKYGNIVVKFIVDDDVGDKKKTLWNYFIEIITDNNY